MVSPNQGCPTCRNLDTSCSHGCIWDHNASIVETVVGDMIESQYQTQLETETILLDMVQTLVEYRYMIVSDVYPFSAIAMTMFPPDFWSSGRDNVRDMGSSVLEAQRTRMLLQESTKQRMGDAILSCQIVIDEQRQHYTDMFLLSIRIYMGPEATYLAFLE
jgi:hypothetical protein